MDDRKLVALLADDVVETVPQQTPALLALADRMLAIGKPAIAEEAWARAVAASDVREPVLAAELRAAAQSHDPALVTRLATALQREATTGESFLAVAQAFAGNGAPARACDEIDRGLRAHSREPLLLVGGARIKLAAGQLEAARTLLGANEQRDFTLEQRRDAQQLLAAIADRTGDVEAAVIARARAQLLERQIHAIRSDGASVGPK